MLGVLNLIYRGHLFPGPRGDSSLPGQLLAPLPFYTNLLGELD